MNVPITYHGGRNRSRHVQFSLLLGVLMTFSTIHELSAQTFKDEECFITILVPDHYVEKNSTEGVDRYESLRNRSLLSMYKDYKGVEGSFISSKSAAEFYYETLVDDEKNGDVVVTHEKVGKLKFSILSWGAVGRRKRITRYIRAFNDDGHFIHCFEISSATSSPPELERAFRSFLKACKPLKKK